MHRPSNVSSLLAALAAAALACSKPPAVGEKVEKPAPAGAAPTHRIGLVSAAVDANRKVQVDFTLVLGETPVALTDLATLRPTFTLAELTVDPESGIPSWKSQLLTGSQTAVQNPIGGPGTKPENVLLAQKQPGSEGAGTFEALPAGGFRYTFANALPDPYETSHTYRVGVWLNGAAGTEDTNATLDFVPAGGTPAPRDLVSDADCSACHERVLAHGRRIGVKVCTTCHTWQAVDPDTVDPAAPLAATTDTNPNPVDFGRLVHRIHRGKSLPTLYASSSTAPAPALGTGPLPYPFGASSTPVAGRKFSIVGFQSRVFTFGEVKTWATASGTTRVVAGGVAFPRDYRDCGVCHAKAAQADQAYTTLTRRTCGACHPDIWFGASAVPDNAHFAHPGGPQADDTLCAECHLATATPTAPRKLYVDNREVHTPIRHAARFSRLQATIVSVSNFLPGQKPTVVFTLSDRAGSLSPLNETAATPPLTPPPNETGPAASPVARKVTRLAFTISGPTSPDYKTKNLPLSESVVPPPAPPAGEPVYPPIEADAQGRFTYTFKTVTVPADATGAWSIMLESRRQLTGRSPFYNPATDTFIWPYTSEAITEFADNAIADVDTATGTTAAGPALARRVVVDEARCNSCHDQLVLHGGNRNVVQGCLLCHAPDQTDWGRRPKNATVGTVNLAATFDGIEERSIEFRTMIHRIHTGAASGTAQLDADPYVIYGFGGTPFWFDEGVFPNRLSNCPACHADETFRLEAIPVGAASRVANENPTIQHTPSGANPAVAGHGTSEPKVPPMTAACTSCHDTGTARNHAAGYVVGGVESCVSCHGATGSLSVYDLHGVARP